MKIAMTKTVELPSGERLVQGTQYEVSDDVGNAYIAAGAAIAASSGAIAPLPTPGYLPRGAGKLIGLAPDAPDVVLDAAQAQALPGLVSGDGIFLGSGGITGKRSFSAASGYIRTAAEYRALQANFSQPANAAQPTARFVDLNRGNDANDGLTQKTPWKSITKLNNLTMGGGSVIALASDSYWKLDDTGTNGSYVQAGNINGSSGNPVYITSYDPAGVTGTKPTIEYNHAFLSSDWTWDATYGAWKTPLYAAPGNNHVYLRLGTVWGQFNRDRTGWAVGEFYADNTDAFLWIYCPQSTDPTSYFGSVVFSSNNLAAIWAWQGLTYTIIENLKFVNCAYGIKFNEGASAGAKLGRIVRNCETQDAGLALLLQSDNTGAVSQLDAYGNRGIGSPGPLLFLSNANKTATGTVASKLYENYSENANQCSSASGAIGIQARGAAQGDISAYRNYIVSPRNGVGHHFFDGCGIYADTKSGNHDVFANVVVNAARAYQDNSGKTSRWIANASIDCDSFGTFTDADNNNAIDYTVAHNTAIRCAVRRWPQGSQSFSRAAMGFWRTPTGVPQGTMGAVRVFNNAITMAPGYSMGCAIEMPNSSKVTTLDVSNNAAFGAFTKGLIGDTYNSNADISSGTLSIALAADPYTGNSVIPAAGALDSAGCMRAVYKDMLGNDFARVPSIGCVEVASA